MNIKISRVSEDLWAVYSKELDFRAVIDKHEVLNIVEELEDVRTAMTKELKKYLIEHHPEALI